MLRNALRAILEDNQTVEVDAGMEAMYAKKDAKDDPNATAQLTAPKQKRGRVRHGRGLLWNHLSFYSKNTLQLLYSYSTVTLRLLYGYSPVVRR